MALSKLFAVLKEKLLKLVSSTEYTDGVEIIAMLVTVHMMIAHRTSFPVQSENLKIWNISMDEIELDWDFMEEMLIECKAVLSQRLDAFVASQLVAFRERKIDPKKTGVFSPVARFPAFIDQLIVFSGSKVTTDLINLNAVVLLLTFISCSVIDYLSDQLDGYLHYTSCSVATRLLDM